MVHGISQITFTILKRAQYTYLIYQAAHLGKKEIHLGLRVGGQITT